MQCHRGFGLIVPAATQNFHYHYVTAREMYNLVKAAEEGWTGGVAEALDYRLVWEAAIPSVRAVGTNCQEIAP